MTYKDAVDVINIAKAEVEWNYPLDYQIAFDTAIEALERCTPMKPRIEIYENRVSKEQKVNVCPRCREVEFGYNRVKFCDNCGQAIYWEDTE